MTTDSHIDIKRQHLREIFPPTLLMVLAGIAFILFISALLYYLVSNICDVIFWTLILVAITVTILVNLGELVNSFVITKHFINDIKDTCSFSQVSENVISGPLFHPWLSVFLFMLALAFYAGAIVVFLTNQNEECNGWFWVLLLAGIIIDLLASVRSYFSSHVLVKLADVELQECNKKVVTS